MWAWPSGLCDWSCFPGELLHEEALFGLTEDGDGKNVQTLWWAELDRLHCMTCATLLWARPFPPPT